MSRFKLAALGVFAMLIVSAMAAASASANTTETRYFVEGAELTTAETVDGVVGVAQLNSVTAGSKLMIECTANEILASGENTIEAGGKSKTKIVYRQCYVYNIKSTGVREQLAGCGVEPIEFSAVDQLFIGPGGLVEDRFEPVEGKLFVTIKLINANAKTCLFKGEYKVEGTYVASLGDEAERSMTEHELVFTSTGSKVTFAGEPASYTNTVSRLKLKSGKNWY
jgi:hypothetical protein